MTSKIRQNSAPLAVVQKTLVKSSSKVAAGRERQQVAVASMSEIVPRTAADATPASVVVVPTPQQPLHHRIPAVILERTSAYTRNDIDYTSKPGTEASWRRIVERHSDSPFVVRDALRIRGLWTPEQRKVINTLFAPGWRTNPSSPLLKIEGNIRTAAPQQRSSTSSRVADEQDALPMHRRQVRCSACHA